MYNIIVALDLNNGIGKNNSLPWHFPEELKYFLKLTKGNGNNAIIMGKNTWNSLPKYPLPYRDNLILSTTLNIEKNTPKNNYIKSFSCINDIEEFCKNQNYDEIWIIGGSEIYNLFINRNKINYIYATLIHNKYDCDCFFPILDNWSIIKQENIVLKGTKISYLKYIKNKKI